MATEEGNGGRSRLAGGAVRGDRATGVDPGVEDLRAALRKLEPVVVPAGGVAIEVPLEQRRTALAQGQLVAVVRPGDEAVQGHRQGHRNLCHDLPLVPPPLIDGPTCSDERQRENSSVVQQAGQLAVQRHRRQPVTRRCALVIWTGANGDLNRPRYPWRTPACSGGGPGCARGATPEIRLPAAAAVQAYPTPGGPSASDASAATPPGSGRRTRGVARGPQPPSAAARTRKAARRPAAASTNWRNCLGMPEPGKNNTT